MRSQGCASVVFRIAQSLFLALSLTLPAAAAQSDGKSVTYQFGVVPQFNAERILAIWQPILLALEKETGLRFRLSGSDSIPAFEKEFSAGRFDFVYMNPYHFVRARRSQGYQPLLRDVGEQISASSSCARTVSCSRSRTWTARPSPSPPPMPWRHQ